MSNMTEEQRAYADAFGREDGQDDSAEGQSGDEPTGVTLGVEGAGGDESALQQAPSGDAGGQGQGEQPPAAAKAEMTEQSLKSWEGRLKAREAAIKAAEAKLEAERQAGIAAASDNSQPNTLAGGGAVVVIDPAKPMDAKPGGEGGDSGKAGGDPAGDDEFSGIKADAQKLAESPDRLKEAVQGAIEDYGRDFLVTLMAMFMPVIDDKAGGYVEKMNGSLSSLSSDIDSALSFIHQDRIEDAHEDVQEIAGSDEFKAWVDAMPEEEKAGAEKVMNEGSAGQIIRLLKKFKASLEANKAPPEPSPEESMRQAWDEAAASSVRSSAPIKVPAPRAKPSEEDEYAAAFNKA